MIISLAVQNWMGRRRESTLLLVKVGRDISNYALLLLSHESLSWRISCSPSIFWDFLIDKTQVIRLTNKGPMPLYGEVPGCIWTEYIITTVVLNFVHSENKIPYNLRCTYYSLACPLDPLRRANDFFSFSGKKECLNAGVFMPGPLIPLRESNC